MVSGVIRGFGVKVGQLYSLTIYSLTSEVPTNSLSVEVLREREGEEPPPHPLSLLTHTSFTTSTHLHSPPPHPLPPLTSTSFTTSTHPHLTHYLHSSPPHPLPPPTSPFTFTPHPPFSLSHRHLPPSPLWPFGHHFTLYHLPPHLNFHFPHLSHTESCDVR